MASPLENRVVLITGASSGIGRACALRFAAAGARLVLAARRAERLAELAATIPDAPSHLLRLDVRDAGAVQAAVDGLPAEFADVEVLVNNAGLSRGLAPLHEGERRDWEEMIDTNVKGLLWVDRAVIPGMVRRGRGLVLHVGSIAGREVYPGGNVYCATKHAVRALTDALRLDLCGTGVRVGSIDPGLVETEFSVVRYRGDRERADATYRGMTPLAADDVAEAVLFAATRPPHVAVADLLLLPADQASSQRVHRDPDV